MMISTPTRCERCFYDGYENNERRDFTPEEKIAIAQAIEAKLAGRNHRPKEVDKILPTYEEKPQGKSSDIAAQSIGMSGEQYRKAKTVFNEGDEETKEAVNKGRLNFEQSYTKPIALNT